VPMARIKRRTITSPTILRMRFIGGALLAELSASL
jgi:hypothetical protein